MNKFSGKTVFVTGGSSGIGYATVKAFANEGANLLICARRSEKLEFLKDELSNSNIKVISLDVRNQNEVKNTLEYLPNQWKSIDILVNNAGLSRGLDYFQNGDINDWDEMIDTNVKGLLYISRVVIPRMIDRKTGHIINIGSIAGHEVYPKGNVYCASKFAVDGITQGMRIDLNGTGIKVTSIDPGLVETEFSLVRFHGDEVKAKLPYQGMTPLTPEDVADAIIYAASRPANVVINEIVIMPIAQSSATIVKRDLI